MSDGPGYAGALESVVRLVKREDLQVSAKLMRSVLVFLSDHRGEMEEIARSVPLTGEGTDKVLHVRELHEEVVKAVGECGKCAGCQESVAPRVPLCRECEAILKHEYEHRPGRAP